MMRIRITSDLHVDYNKINNFKFMQELDQVDLNIIAGDIAGDYLYEQKFINTLKTNTPVAIVAGNHLGYNYLFRKERTNNPFIGTREHSLNELVNQITPIHYLENSDFLCNGKLIFGGTMFTDFSLYQNPEASGNLVMKHMNDFIYVHTQDDEIRTVNYKDYIKWFNLFIAKLNQRLEETKEDNLDVIVITHFAPSPKSLKSGYLDYFRGPGYATNLEEFIKNNPRIKLWVHGHVHTPFDYEIGNCRITCCPYGYNNNEEVASEYIGKVIEID